MVFAVLLDENDVCVEHRVGLVTSSARGRGALWALVALAGRSGCSGRSPAGSLGRGCRFPARCLILLIPLSPAGAPPALAACA